MTYERKFSFIIINIFNFYLQFFNSFICTFSADDNSDTSFREDQSSPNVHHNDDSEDGSVNHPALFRPSPESAFSKIGKQEFSTDTGSLKSPYFPASASTGMPGLYPGFFPNFYSSHFLLKSSEAGASTSPSSTFPSPFQFPEKTSPLPETSKDVENIDKSMFYYVDPRIPFTNYFLNLTKLLNSSSKECTATTPLGKMAGDDHRADDREPPITPDSSKSVSGKSRSETISSPESENSSAENDERPERKELKVDIVPDKLNIPNLSDPRFVNPFSSGLLQPSHTGGILPVPGAGLFHPALMHLPGSAYRRYNPEKPPPVKKYKCDVCGKAFSRSNTLVTHKVGVMFHISMCIKIKITVLVGAFSNSAVQPLFGINFR